MPVVFVSKNFIRKGEVNSDLVIKHKDIAILCFSDITLLDPNIILTKLRDEYRGNEYPLYDVIFDTSLFISNNGLAPPVRLINSLMSAGTFQVDDYVINSSYFISIGDDNSQQSNMITMPNGSSGLCCSECGDFYEYTDCAGKFVCKSCKSYENMVGI